MKLQTTRIESNELACVPTLPGEDSSQTLVLCFGSSSWIERPEIFRALAQRFPQAHILGCSSSGEIFNQQVHDDSASIAVCRFEHTRLASAFAAVVSPKDSFDAGKLLARKLLAPDLKGLLVLSEGLGVNGSELIRGINEQLPRGVLVTGGLAGDMDRFKRTWVLYEGQPVERMVSAVGFYGDRIHLGHGSQGGWDQFGPERVITKSQGNVLFELDGRPALEIYEKYLGEKAKELPGSALLFPLCLRQNEREQERVTRTVLGVSKPNQSMIFAGNMPEGGRAQMMKANFDRLIEAAALAADTARFEGVEAANTLSIAISCVGRRLILGERTEQELEAALAVQLPGTQQVGFYSYGELSPFTGGSACHLHNQTMTLTTLCET